MNKLSIRSTCCFVETEENEELFDDDYNYDTNEDLHRDEPRSSMEWFDLRSRRRRQASEEPRKESSFIYTVCVG